MFNKNTPDLAVIVVAFHNVKDITKMVSSVVNHTNASINMEIYIVDNGNSPQEYKPLVRNYHDVVYIDAKSNLGFGSANNIAIKRTRARYVAIVNPDIMLNEDSFSIMLAYMQTRGVRACVPRLVDREGNLQPVYRRKITVVDLLVRIFFRKLFPRRVQYHTMGTEDYSKPFIVPFAQGSFLVVETSLLKELHGFDERFFMYMEDADLTARINEKAPLYYFPGTSVVHKWNRGSHRNLKLLSEHVKSIAIYFNKWGFFKNLV